MGVPSLAYKDYFEESIFPVILINDIGMRSFFILIIILILTACSQEESMKQFDLQGHRGARGLVPENTIPGFLLAVDLGVNTLEFDLVVTKDHKLLVSHEPYFHHNISSKPDGSPVSEDEQMSFNIFEMTFEETQQFDVGKRGHVLFPGQEAMEVKKPLLIDAIRTVETYTLENNLPSVAYNMETKSYPDQYGIMVPYPETFAKLLYQELSILDEDYDLLNRVIIQSFDPATLIEFRKLDPDVKLAMLVADDGSIDSYISTLGFVPEIWSPNFRLLTTEIITEAHNLGMKVIPWTVNTVEDMRNQLEMGVDGIITDYPDSAAVLR
tara:strand:- start:49043 stop:50017 length:975 start_codon:yes stop_codon:yes gene_type:complete